MKISIFSTDVQFFSTDELYYSEVCMMGIAFLNTKKYRQFTAPTESLDRLYAKKVCNTTYRTYGFRPMWRVV